MNRAIQHQDVLNIKTRFRLFFLAVIFGAALGGATGWQWTHRSMNETETVVFDKFAEAFFYQKIGWGDQPLQGQESGNRDGIALAILPIEKDKSRQMTADQFLLFMHHRAPQLAQEFHAKAVRMFLYFPAGGALAGVALLIILSTLIKTEERN